MALPKVLRAPHEMSLGTFGQKIVTRVLSPNARNSISRFMQRRHSLEAPPFTHLRNSTAQQLWRRFRSLARSRLELLVSISDVGVPQRRKSKIRCRRGGCRSDGRKRCSVACTEVTEDGSHSRFSSSQFIKRWHSTERVQSERASIKRNGFSRRFLGDWKESNRSSDFSGF